jgi:hypothetical protein
VIVLGDPTHGRAIAAAAHTYFDADTMPVISRVTADGNLWGGVIYSDYTGTSCRIHMAGTPGWASVGMIWIAFDYPFNTMKVDLLLGTVSSLDRKVIEYDRRLGFSEITRIPAAVPGGDLIILGMERRDCPWLKYRKRYMKPNGRSQVENLDVHVGS